MCDKSDRGAVLLLVVAFQMSVINILIDIVRCRHTLRLIAGVGKLIC